MKKIYIETFGKMHTQTKLVASHKFQGYIFAVQKDVAGKGFASSLKKTAISRIFYRHLKNIYLNSSYCSKNIPEDADLIITGRPRDIQKPYILEILDNITGMAGYDYDLFTKNLKRITTLLSSDYCKKIIIVNETSFGLMRKYFPAHILKKTVLIRAAVKKQNFSRDYGRRNIQVLFLGSITNPEDFYSKGGLEALESYKRISEEFDNINMVFRCKVPEEIKERYVGVKNLTFLDNFLSEKELSDLMKSSDISLLPGHHYSLMATLESMSYGLPIIALDTWAVKDYLKKDYAIILKPSKKIKSYCSKYYPDNIRLKSFIKETKEIDEEIINGICAALRKLILNPSLRKKLGTRAKKTAETKFSLNLKVKKLKQVFDEALA